MAKKKSRTERASQKKQEDRRLEAQDYRTRHSQDVGIHYFQEIAAGPVNRRRRMRATKSLKYSCEQYFPNFFSLGWASYHLEAIKRIEAAVFRKQLFAFAVPRGGGKTSLCLAAMAWAALNGHSFYPLLVTATAASAGRGLRSIKSILRNNPLLAEDYPEIIYPLKFLRNESSRVRGQKFFGESTEIDWKTDYLIFPSLDLGLIPEEQPEWYQGKWTPGSKVRKNYKGLSMGWGAVVDIASMEGEIRGRQVVRPDGTIARPDFSIVDDPQTRRSARSLALVAENEAKLSGDVQFLGGPTKRNGVVIPCTVILEGDLASRLLDEDLHPEYRPVRARMVEKFPPGFEDFVVGPESDDESDQIKLWREYRKIQVQDFSQDTAQATEFYRANQKQMDRGFKVSWPHRFAEDEISAIQAAVNLYFKDEGAFYAEAQNDPSKGVRDDQDSKRLVPDDILKRRNGVDRAIVPEWADCLTAFIDISEQIFWWVVCAYRKSDFTASVVEFGTAPDQKADYYALSRLRKTLSRKHKGKLFETILQDELATVVDRLAVKKTWATEDDREISLDAIGIDSGWGEYALDVYKFCRRSPHKNILQATKGVGVRASDPPFVDPEAKRKGLESVHGQWRVSRTKVRTPLLRYDANYWKTRIYGLLKVTLNAPSSFTVCQLERVKLRVLAEQLTSETSTRVETKKRIADQWSQIPGRDNHFLDGVVGCSVLAHRKGAQLPAQRKATAKAKRSPKSERKAKKREKDVQANQKRRRGGRRRTDVRF